MYVKTIIKAIDNNDVFFIVIESVLVYNIEDNANNALRRQYYGND